MANGKTQIVIGGRWRVTRQLGAGAFCSAFEVEDLSAPERAKRVVKVANNEEGIESLQEELRVAENLHHDNICAIRDVSRDDLFGLYLVLDHGGESLASLIAHGPLPLHLALEIIRQVGDGLDYAHRKNVLHQDIKPHNILVTQVAAGVQVRLADFGVSLVGKRGLTTGGSSTVLASSIIGLTKAYAAPEQRRGVARAASDRYSLALVFASMLLGELFKQPPEPASVIVMMPQRFRVGMERALAADPSARVRTCREYVELLELVPPPVPSLDSPPRLPTGLRSEPESHSVNDLPPPPTSNDPPPLPSNLFSEPPSLPISEPPSLPTSDVPPRAHLLPSGTLEFEDEDDPDVAQLNRDIDDLISSMPSQGTPESPGLSVHMVPEHGGPGDRLRQKGEGFTPYGSVELHVVRPSGLGRITTVTANGSGRFSRSYRIGNPPDEMGTYHFYAIDLTTKEQSLAVNFEVG